VLLRRYRERASTVICNSRSVANDVKAALGVGLNPDVVLNAVDLDRFSPDGPRLDLDAVSGLSSVADEVVRVGLVGAFAWWKGHEIFLQALAMLPASPAVRGYVIGDSIYETGGSQMGRGALQRLAVKLHLEGRAGFTGFQPAPEAMRALDVVVHASTQPEPFGMVLAEAMACGRPVITTATGGAREFIDPGRTAVAVRPGDAAELAAAITRLAADPARRASLGRAARAAALAAFDPARLTRDVVELYKRVAGQAATARRTVA
jgi:glycosyltransferase involved in cell wall biosynthesis